MFRWLKAILFRYGMGSSESETRTVPKRTDNGASPTNFGWFRDCKPSEPGISVTCSDTRRFPRCGKRECERNGGNRTHVWVHELYEVGEEENEGKPSSNEVKAVGRISQYDIRAAYPEAARHAAALDTSWLPPEKLWCYVKPLWEKDTVHYELIGNVRKWNG
jgi:hypothetical protein